MKKKKINIAGCERYTPAREVGEEHNETPST